ncbi:MAG: hypothetical protein NC416_18585 [Eubacterium sp.]|nr:hypothetical protein [Eubacterium sp.]
MKGENKRTSEIHVSEGRSEIRGGNGGFPVQEGVSIMTSEEYKKLLKRHNTEAL